MRAAVVAVLVVAASVAASLVPRALRDRPAVSMRLVLDSHTVASGGTITGRIELRNETGHTVYRGSMPCQAASLGVGLESSTVTYQVFLQACAVVIDPVEDPGQGRYEVPPGTTDIPVRVRAVYGACGSSGGGGEPRCDPGRRTASLPPGRYWTTVAPNAPRLEVRPQVVDVTG